MRTKDVHRRNKSGHDGRSVQANRTIHKSSSHHLKHCVGIGGLFGDFLTHVPVLDHLAVFQTENVDDGAAAATGRRHVVDVQDYVVAVGKDALDLAVIVGKFLAQIGKERLQSLRSIGGARI